MQPGALMHGLPGLLSAYAAVQGPMLAGMVRARAPWRRLLLAPVIAVPVTVAAGLGVALLTPGLSSLGIASDSFLQLSAGIGLSAALGFVSGSALGRMNRSPTLHVRGAIVASVPEAQARNSIVRGTARSRARSGALTLAGVAVDAADETKHFKLIGTTGTGKSTAIRELLGGALARGDRAVIADPDGGYLRHFGNAARGDVVLNPFEPGSVKWDLFGELAETQDVEQLARSLIPDHEGPDRSWRGYARTFFSAVTDQARSAGVSDIRELYRLLVVAGTSELKTLVAGTPAQPFLEEHNGRMFDSIRSVTSSAVAPLAYVSRQEGGAPFSVRRWTRGAVGAGHGEEERGVLFIPYRAGQIAALRSVISAWMRLAIFEAMDRAEGEMRLWFVVDELDALGQIDGLKDALARLRKFGGRCVLGFQSVAQVSATYGAGEAQTLVENCGNTLVLRCAGSEHGGTSQFASRLIGEREVLRTSVSRSQRPFELLPVINRSENSTVEVAVMASEIEQLPDLAGYLKLASHPQWLQVTLERPAPAHISAAPEMRRPPTGAASNAHLLDGGREGLGL
jgi:type IV secretory pathway TraG/TraD family ATPase VirD4